MTKSIALTADASRLVSLLLSYIQAVCAFVAPRQPGASTASIDRLSHSRALKGRCRAKLAPMLCPHCQQNAPILYKGVFAFCSACDKPRAPFSGKALAFAGQPSKVGGRVGRVVGALVLILGLLLAA